MAIVVPIISSFDNKGIQKALKDFKSLEGAGQRGAFSLMGTTKAVNTAGKNFAKLGAIGAGLAGVIGGSLVSAAYESQKVMKQTDAIIKATGGAAGLTGDQVGKLSQKLSLQAGVDDELIQKSLNLLLTFKKVHNEAGKGNDIFNRTAQAVLDMGNVFGSTDRAAIQLGKALSDPEKGITALKRSGIDFTAQQKEQIKTLVASGKTLDAQKLILAEIESQVGGTAAATATGFDRMKVAIGNVQENLGNLLIPAVERFSTAIINNVLPVLDQFGEIVGEQGIGAGINFMVGSIVNGITKLGTFGKVIIGLTTGIVALNIATGVYKGTMTALNIVTTISNGAMKSLITSIGAAKVAMATAGAITAVLVAAGLAYGVYSSRKAEAAQTTKDLTGALLAEKSAQSGLLVELYNSSKTARAFIDTQDELGLSTDDLAQYVKSGTGVAAKYATAWKQADAQANGIQPTLIKYRELLGLSSDTSLIFVARIRNMVEQLEKMKGKQTELNAITALANKLSGVTGNETKNNIPTITDLAKVVETAAQKFDKFKTAVTAANSASRSMAEATKAVGSAQTNLTSATQKVIDAQTKLNQIVKGFGAGSTQAIAATKDLTTAQNNAARAAMTLTSATKAVVDAKKKLADLSKPADQRAIQVATDNVTQATIRLRDAERSVFDAKRKISDLNKAADPRTVQEATDNVTEASFRLLDAQEALNKARQSGTSREIAEAEIDVRSATNGVADANDRLVETQKAADPALLAQAQDDLTVAEIDAKNATGDLSDAQKILKDTQDGASPQELKDAQDELKQAQIDLTEATQAQADADDAVREAQKKLNEVVSGATKDSDTYKQALIDLQDAQKDEVDAIDNLSDAKYREFEATKALTKANILLQQSRKKLSAKQLKEAQKAVKDLTFVPVAPKATPISTGFENLDFGTTDFGGIDFSKIDFSGIDFSGIDLSGIATLASGGIVTKPTISLIGEGGEPEAVIPLSKLGGMGGGDVYNITINSKIADQTLPDLLVAELRKFNRRSGAIDIQVA
jgi:hypothetical protein